MKNQNEPIQLAPGVLKFKRYKYATDYMEAKSLTGWKIFENPGNGFLLYKKHTDLRNALNQQGQKIQLAKAIGLQFATNMVALLDKKFISKIKKPKTATTRKIKVKTTNGFPDKGILFTASKQNKLEYYKEGSFYFYNIYDLSKTKQYDNGTIRYWYSKRTPLFKKRKNDFLEYLSSRNYI